MIVTVTGGAGFVGHHLVAALLRRGHEVRVLDNLYRGDFDRPGLDGARLLTGDVREPADCDRAIAGCDAVLHLAAQANVMGGQADTAYCFETNVQGTWNVLSAARDGGAKHVVLASSREVYGEPAELPVREDAPLRPKNAYGGSKVAAEALTAMLPEATLPGEGLAVSILRLANVVGPGDHDRVVPLWSTAASSGEPLTIYGGEQQIDFIDVDTVVACFVRLVEGGPVAGAVNVGSGRTVTLPELAERVRAAFDSRSEVRVLPRRSPEVTRFRADVTRMRELLGVEPPGDALAALRSFGCG